MLVIIFCHNIPQCFFLIHDAYVLLKAIIIEHLSEESAFLFFDTESNREFESPRPDHFHCGAVRLARAEGFAADLARDGLLLGGSCRAFR